MVIEQCCWDYQGKCFETVTDTTYGFVYLIKSIEDGRIYVGKKAFTHRCKKKISKRVIKSTKTRKRIEVTAKDSGWLNYWGSSKELLQEINLKGKNNFTRCILSFAKNKSDLSLKELEEQIKHNVLRVPSFNNWIGAKVYKRFINET